MAIDIAADVATILGSTADFTRTSATWTKSDGTTSDTVTGILFERTAEKMSGTLSRLEAIYLVATTEFSNVTVRDPFDSIAVTGYSDWKVEEVRERIAHVFVRLVKDVQRGRSQ